MPRARPPYRGGVLRAILRPAPLGLLVLVLALATGFAFLGQWQLERSQAKGSAPALERVQPLTDVLAPAETFTGPVDGQVVTATGRFRALEGPDGADGADGAEGSDVSTQVLVPGRSQAGRDGSWVVAPFDVEGSGDPGGAGSTAVLAVVRGWLPPEVASRGLAGLPPPPQGEITVTGRLLLGEPARGVTRGSGGAPSVRSVAPADLVNLWGAPIYTGFVIASASDAPLQAVVAGAPTRGTDFRSLSYGFQWFLFAGLALFAWWRVVKERFLPEELAAVDDELVAAEARRERSTEPARDPDDHHQPVEAP